MERLQGEHGQSSGTQDDGSLGDGSGETRELRGGWVGGEGAVAGGGGGGLRASASRSGGRSTARRGRAGRSRAGWVAAGAALGRGGRGLSGSRRSGSGRRLAASWGGDADGHAGGRARVLDALDDLGLVIGRACLLDAGGDGRDERVALLAVASEVKQAVAAVRVQRGDEAVQLRCVVSALSVLLTT